MKINIKLFDGGKFLNIKQMALLAQIVTVK